MGITEDMFDPKADSPLPDEELKSKKNRYANFDAAVETQRMTRHAFGADALHAMALDVTANVFDHLVYEVVVPGYPPLIYRIATGSIPAHYFTVEKRMYEVWCERGIPTPKIYAVHLRDGLFPYDWMIIEKVGTKSLEHHLHEHPEDDDYYTIAAGELLARMHALTVPKFGLLSIDQATGDIGGAQPSWSDAMHLRLNETVAFLHSHSLISRNDMQEIEAAFSRHKDVFTLQEGVALHGDYHDANILIDSGKRTVVAAIDLSQVKSGDPLFDVAFYLTYYPQQKVDRLLEGYARVARLHPDFRRRIALHALRIYLSKAKLRKRFGYEDRIPAAIEGITRSLRVLA